MAGRVSARAAAERWSPPCRARSLLGFALAGVCLCMCSPGVAQDELSAQRAQYDADVPKTILELQPFRTQVTVHLPDEPGVTASLTDLNPNIGAWYLLTLDSGGGWRRSYHLESPRHQGLRLAAAANAIRLSAGASSCLTWPGGTADPLEQAERSGLPYAPLCGGALYLRNPVSGHRTSLELITDFLRDHVWGGEQVITFVKREISHDAYLEHGGLVPVGPQRVTPVADAPRAATIAPGCDSRGVSPGSLALDVSVPREGLPVGAWYPVGDPAGIFFSAFLPECAAAGMGGGPEPHVNPLDGVEAQALVYLVAFDLARVDLHFVLGTEHPRLDWSTRPPPSSQDARLPGPDGVDSPAPLITNGMIPPADAPRTVATFIGGFKRVHGAFRYGVLAGRNHGSHYGFIEDGVIFSKLQPGLATVIVTADGSVDMRTWSQADDAGLAHIRYARQNGVPLIEYDARRGVGVPGALVSLWGPGNWSGSADEVLRTLRAGLCLQEAASRRFIIYGYFSSATPSAMARVFQAYGCRYAMLLDINALEHTYLAVYGHRGGQVLVEHLVEGMKELDRGVGGRLAPRFLGFPDDRDFFYLTQHEAPP
ncbi:MAG TPA: hypothetical protein VMB48_04940 [Steroidobacteraceae bacterium]|nr:hypothetical protein [Steroidobacteraceae bacterium]